MSAPLVTVAELEQDRAEAESLMTVTFAAYSPNGTSTNADGFHVRGFTSQGSTFGKVQGRSQHDTAATFIQIGNVDRPILKAGLHIPITAPIPAAGHPGHGWEYLCTAVGELDDPSLLGRRYLVVEVPAKSIATARRLDVVQL